MVFLTTESDDPADGGGSSGGQKATLDISDIGPSDEVPRALQKVELDLDDAPFLEEEEEEAAAEEAPVAEAPPAEAAAAPSRRLPVNKKIILIGAVGLIVLLGLAVGAYFFFFRGASPDVTEAPAPPPHEEAKPETPPPPPPPAEVLISFAPFWVEKPEGDKIRFLHLKFSVATTDPTVELELQAKLASVRDSIYYYLRNKPLATLSDTASAEELKRDLPALVNKFLGNGQVDKVFIEEYLVQ